jgi:hypothetical protein
MSDFVPWLRGLAEQGGKGIVNNIDARSLGRIADELECLRAENSRLKSRGSDILEVFDHDFNSRRR